MTEDVHFYMIENVLAISIHNLQKNYNKRQII